MDGPTPGPSGACCSRCSPAGAPFGGATLSDTIAQVLERDPDWDTLPKGTQAKVRDLLERCLEKDARNRQRDFGDVRIEIERALSEPLIPSHEAAAAPAPLSRMSAAVLVVGLISVVTAFIIWNSRPPGLDTAPRPPRLENIRRVTSLPGNEDQPVLSPDGQFVAFVSETAGNLDIWIQPILGEDPIQVTKDQADDYDPDWSPDGATIAFRSNRTNGGLYTISAFGGDATRIADFGYQPRWSPDGRWIAFQLRRGTLVTNEIFVVPYPPGPSPEKLFASDVEVGSALHAEWSPDGHHLVYHQSPGGPSTLLTTRVEHGLAVLPRADPENRWMLEFDGTVIDGLMPVWLPDGRGIIASVPVPGQGPQRLQYIALDSDLKAAAPPFQLTTGPGDHYSSISGDGRRVAYNNSSGQTDIWKVELDLETRQPVGEPIRVTANPANETRPLLLPDDQHVLFLSNRNNQNHIYVADTSGENERLVDDTRSWEGAIRSISPDGRWITIFPASRPF